jgi:hypothetical protein
MKGKYFIDRLNSFYLGSPDMVEAWKRTIKIAEDEGNDVVAFSLPKHRCMELIEVFEHILKEKLK